MSKMFGIPSPYKPWAPKPPFWTTLQLNGKYNGLYLRNKARYRQSVKCVDNYKSVLHRLKISWTSVHKRLQTGPPFLPTPCKFCLLHHSTSSLLPVMSNYLQLLDELCCRTATFIKSCLESDSPIVSAVARYGV